MNDITVYFIPSYKNVKCDCCGETSHNMVLVQHQYMRTRLCEACVKTVKPGLTLKEFSARLHV